MLFRGIIAICRENRAKHTNALCGLDVDFLFVCNVMADGT